jgi:uncharacterized surface protein with fasciclin (FAS1) repeats
MKGKNYTSQMKRGMSVTADVNQSNGVIHVVDTVYCQTII